MGDVTENGNREAGGFPEPGSLPRPPQNFILCRVCYLSLPPSSIGCSRATQALYLGLSSQHRVAQTSAPRSLFASIPGEHSPISPLSAEHSPPSPEQSFKEMANCFPCQGCHLPNTPTGSSENNFNNSEPSPRQSL